jgi:hypothetical protein
MKALRQVRALTQDPADFSHRRQGSLAFKRDEFGEARWLADSFYRCESPSDWQ